MTSKPQSTYEFESPCEIAEGDMNTREDGWFCDHCQKTVVDASKMTQAQFDALLERYIEIDPEHREALAELKTIYTKKRAWKALFDVLSREAQLSSDPDARLELKIELARLAGDRLHKHDEAIALWKEVIAEQPDFSEALESLVKLADKEKDWESLAGALELQLERTDEERRRIKILQKPVLVKQPVRKKPLRDLTQTEEQQLEARLEGVENDRLRQALRKLGAQVIARSAEDAA